METVEACILEGTRVLATDLILSTNFEFIKLEELQVCEKGRMMYVFDRIRI